MTRQEAEKIVNAYGSAIARGEIRRLKWLPCSKAKIKQAYFLYLSAIYKEYGYLPDDITQTLVGCYCMLNNFVNDEQADRLEIIKSRIEAKTLDFDNEDDVSLFKEWTSNISGKGENNEGGILDLNLRAEIIEYIEELLAE